VVNRVNKIDEIVLCCVRISVRSATCAKMAAFDLFCMFDSYGPD
jgi:hypothetical protein